MPSPLGGGWREAPGGGGDKGDLIALQGVKRIWNNE